MKTFDNNILAVLNERFSTGTEYVESVLLANYGFHIRFGTFGIQCNEKVFGKIAGKIYELKEPPTSGPWGLFVRQTAKRATLENELLLNIEFVSGDCLAIETLKGQYESVLFDFPPQGDTIMMEIY